MTKLKHTGSQLEAAPEVDEILSLVNDIGHSLIDMRNSMQEELNRIQERSKPNAESKAFVSNARKQRVMHAPHMSSGFSRDHYSQDLRTVHIIVVDGKRRVHRYQSEAPDSMSCIPPAYNNASTQTI